jgi:hypothetical protein
MTPATWNCTYVAGGPAGAFLNSIQPSASQSLVAGGTITFTFDFELNQDAGILFSTWTINGTPVPPGVYTPPVEVCNYIDVHFLQWVDGCTGYNVTMNETSWLQITQTGGPPGVQIVVVDDWCAVDKTPQPSKKLSQVPSINNVTALPGQNITLTPLVPAQLDVTTVWQLVKGLNYTKGINWFGISRAPFMPGVHPCVLFELVLPVGGALYQFTLQASAEVALVGNVDVNPANNQTMSPPLFISVV